MMRKDGVTIVAERGGAGKASKLPLPPLPTNVPIVQNLANVWRCQIETTIDRKKTSRTSNGCVFYLTSW